MPNDPLVCAICLTRNRPEMLKRAVRCWQAQIYSSRLVILDNGTVPLHIDAGTLGLPAKYSDGFTGVHIVTGRAGSSIGALRNEAIENVSRARIGFPPADIIVHWDDDDLSHPNRIAEQVALLQSSGAAVVGYRDLLFWDQRKYAAARERHEHDIAVGGQAGGSVEGYVNEAWLFTDAPNHAPGTTFAYWRKTWEHCKFSDLMAGEDGDWLRRVGWQNAETVSSLRAWPVSDEVEKVANIRGWTYACDPRMIATIHGANTCSKIMPNAPEWKRVPQWDITARRMVEDA